MTQDWRKKPRRRIRSAPLQRPTIELSPEFRSRVEELAGPRLAKPLLRAFNAGTLPGTPEEFHALEAALVQVAREELVGKLLLAVVEQVHTHEEFVVWSMGAARRRTAALRVTSDRSVSLRVTGGEARVESPYMAPSRPKGKKGPRRRTGRRGKGGGGLYPVLAALGFVKKVSPFVASEVALNATRLSSYEEAADALKRQGIDLDPDTVRGIANAVADTGLADREREDDLEESRDLAEERVVICADGGRLRCRKNKPGTRLPSGLHGYDTPWQEPKVLAAYSVDANGEKIRDVRPVYEGTLAPWKDAIPLFAATLRRHGVEDAKLIAIAADGSDNIWREVDQLIELAGLDRSKVVMFLDFYHAMEHLHDAAKLSTLFKSDRSRETWVRQRAELFKAGKAERVIADLLALPTSDEDAPALAKEAKYFSDRLRLLRYDRIQALGFPIGTGAVESAIRRIVNLRLKSPGTFWRPENAERMLYLRCRAKAGRWDEVERALHRAALVPARTARPEILDRVA